MTTEFVKDQNGDIVCKMDVTKDVIEICDKVRSLGYKGDEAEEVIYTKLLLLFGGCNAGTRQAINKLTTICMRRI